MSGSPTAALAIETSTRAGSVAIATENGASAERQLEGERAHATDLLPSVAALAEQTNCEPAMLEVVFVGTGPGSYTGLRIGIATALGLGRGVDARVVGVPSFEALVWQELEAGEEAAVVLDAHAGQVYFAAYRRDSDDVAVLVEPSAIAREDLTTRLSESIRVLCDQKSHELLEGSHVALENCTIGALPRAAAVLTLGLLRLEAGRSDSPDPLYLRPFAAKVRRR